MSASAKPDRVELDSGFVDVDGTGDASKYVTRLDSMRLSPFWRSIKRRSFQLLELSAGDRVLEVGCGTGDDAQELAALVEPDGKVIGIDTSREMIAEAQRRAIEARSTVAFEKADVMHLPFADGYFSCCRAERVLQHLNEPSVALAEMARVVRPGGTLVAIEPDYGSLTIRGAPAEDVTQRILRIRREHFRSSRVGSELPSLMRQIGLRVLKVEVKVLCSTSLSAVERSRLEKYAAAAVSVGIISAGEARQWRADLESAAQHGNYYHGLPIFLVSGRT
jgi:SAM-dependent methyltransferase